MMRRNRTKGPAPVAEPQAVQGESPSDTTAAEAEYRRCVIASATSTNGQVLPTRDVFLALSRSPADFAEAVAVLRSRFKAVADLAEAARLNAEAAAIQVEQPPREAYHTGPTGPAPAPGPEKMRRHELRKAAISAEGGAAPLLAATISPALRERLEEMGRNLSGARAELERVSELGRVAERLLELQTAIVETELGERPLRPGWTAKETVRLARKEIADIERRYPQRERDHGCRDLPAAQRRVARLEAEYRKLAELVGQPVAGMFFPFEQ